MKKLTALLLILLSSLSLIACGDKGNDEENKETVPGGTVVPTEPTHEHSFNRLQYAYDAKEHWYECSCGEKEEAEAHSPIENDSHEARICTECNAVYTSTTYENLESIGVDPSEPHNAYQVLVYSFFDSDGDGYGDLKGGWEFPGGKIEENETAKEAACREVFEECGVKINPKMLTLHNVVTDPAQNCQNVTLRFCGMINKSRLKFSKPEGGEENEVSEVALIPFHEVSKYKWAFGHDEIIQTIYLDEFY